MIGESGYYSSGLRRVVDPEARLGRQSRASAWSLPRFARARVEWRPRGSRMVSQTQARRDGLAHVVIHVQPQRHQPPRLASSRSTTGGMRRVDVLTAYEDGHHTTKEEPSTSGIVEPWRPLYSVTSSGMTRRPARTWRSTVCLSKKRARSSSISTTSCGLMPRRPTGLRPWVTRSWHDFSSWCMWNVARDCVSSVDDGLPVARE